MLARLPALPPTRRWFQFRLRTLLAATTVLAIVFGLHRYLIDGQRAAAEKITKCGGSVEYLYIVPDFLQPYFDCDSVGYITWASVPRAHVPMVWEELRSLRCLRTLEIDSPDSAGEHMDSATFAEVLGSALPRVVITCRDVGREREVWDTRIAPLQEFLPKELWPYLDGWGASVCTDALQRKDGSVHFLLWVTNNYGSVRHWTAAVLTDGNEVLDWKVDGPRMKYEFVTARLEDVDGDGDPDVAYRIEGIIQPGREKPVISRPADERQWLSAYSIHADGLVSISAE